MEPDRIRRAIYQATAAKAAGRDDPKTDSRCELTHRDGTFVDYVASMAEAWKNGSPPTVTEAQAFMYRWCLDADSMRKLQELPLQLLGLVIRSFGPVGDAATWNCKFTEHAFSIERAWRHRGVDCYRAPVHVLLSPGAASTPCEATRQQCGTICVMGLHNSGT